MIQGHHNPNFSRPTAMALVNPERKGSPVVYCNRKFERLFSKVNPGIIEQPVAHLAKGLLDDATIDKLNTVLHNAEETAFRAGHDGAEGPDLLRQGTDPVMRISDYWLPGMNGIECRNKPATFYSTMCQRS